MAWQCFMVEEYEPYVQWFTICSNKHRVVIQEQMQTEFEGASSEPPSGWPDHCSECGVVITDDDTRSRMGSHTWRNVETGEIYKTLNDAGVGAMFDASRWTPSSWRGPDGLSLSVVLPPLKLPYQPTVWHIDGPAGGQDNAPAWTRQGTPPNITASPSILTGDYHGFLQNGALTDSLPDRPL